MTKVLSVSLTLQAELQAGISQLVEAFAQRKASEVQAAVGQMHWSLGQTSEIAVQRHALVAQATQEALAQNTVSLWKQV